MQLTKNFHLDEFRCKDDDRTPVPPELIGNVRKLANNLQVLRDYLGERIDINSGYRTPEYNESLRDNGHKPAKNSQHLKATAADIVTRNKTPRQLAAIIERLIAQGKMHNGGLGIYKGFVHYDVRPRSARWTG